MVADVDALSSAPLVDDYGHIVVVDDDSEIRILIARYIERFGYRVTGVRDGVGLEDRLANGGVDLILLDLMLPGRSGLDVCRAVRGRYDVPIIIISAKSDETERILGLEVGADDYLPKPFNPRELLARIRAVFRRVRGRTEAEPTITGRLGFEGWSLDLRRRELVSPSGVVVDLSTGEFDLLIALAEHPNRVLTREQLLELAKSRTSDAFDRSIDVQVSRLRKKLETDASSMPLIKTVRGAGYMFLPDVKPIR